MPRMPDPIRRLLDIAKEHEPSGGYFGPETLVDILEQNSSAMEAFRAVFEGVRAEQLDDLEDQPEYGWIIAGAADELDLLPDDPRLFKSNNDLVALPDDEVLGELRSACILNDVNAVETLSKRVDVNQLDHHNQLALGYAVGNNHIDCVRILLENGADPNCVGNCGNTPLHDCASTVSSKEILKLLVRYGGKLEIQNDDGKTPAGLLETYGRSNWLA